MGTERLQVPGDKPALQFLDDWSEIKAALAALDKLKNNPYSQENYRQIVGYLGTLLFFVPVLITAYSELWDLSQVLTAAAEKLMKSRDDLYVPDAAEMVQEIANPRRSRR